MSLIGDTKRSILLELNDSSKNGYQVADNLGISKGGVYNHLQDLEEEGMIKLAEKQEGGRGAKKYEITENGMLLLEALGEIDSRDSDTGH